jgi:hypothetical protein
MTVDAVPPFEREGKILSRSYFVGVGVHSASRTTRTISRGFEVWAEDQWWDAGGRLREAPHRAGRRSARARSTC